MKFDQPLQMDTSVKTYETPKIDITKEQFTDAYMKGFEELSRTVYGIGKKFSQLDKEMEQNKEFLRVSEEIEQARADYNKEWENPEKINLNDENWVAGRNEALANLRTAEFDIIRNSKLNNISKEKLAKTSNSNYRERGVRYVFQQGDFTRKRNLDLALTNIDSYIGFLETTDLESDREYIMNKINNSRDVLRKYGVDMAMTDLGIVNKIDDAMKKSMKEQINQLFIAMEPEQATQQANTLVTEYSQKFARIVSQLDDVPKEANAYEFMESFYKANKQEMSKYIKERETHIKRSLERTKKIYESEIQAAINLNDPQKLGILTLNYKFGTTGFLKNENGVLNKMTNTDKENFYDIDKPEIFPVLTNDYINFISNGINELKKEGYTGRLAYQPLYDMVEKLTGGESEEDKKDKEVMILKHYASQKGINPYALLRGKDDSDYIYATEGIRTGKNYIANTNYRIDEEVLGINAMFNLDLLAYNFSQTNNVLGRNYAVKFVVGMLYNDEATRKNMEIDADVAIKEALNNKEVFKYLFDLSKKAAEFETQRTYRIVNLKDPRIVQDKNQTIEKKEEKTANDLRGW